MEHVIAHRTEKDKKEMSHFERFVTDGNEKADELAKKVRCGMKDLWRKREQRQCSKKEKCTKALQYAASFHCLVEEWKDCEGLKPKPKGKVGLRASEKRGSEASNGVLMPTSIDA